MPTSYVDVFGGANIFPAEISYSAVILSGDTIFSWPVESSAAVNFLTDIMNVTAIGGGSVSIILPDARMAAPGATVLFNNKGMQNFSVKSSTGVTLITLLPGTVWQLYLTDNSTQSGLWDTFQFGVGVSQAQAASLAGGGLVAVGTLLAQDIPVTNLNTSYLAGAADRSSAFVWTGAGGTLTLPDPSAAGITNGWFIQLSNQGIGALIVDPNGSTSIDGLSTKTFNPGDTAFIISTGTNYITIGYGRSATFAFDYTSITVAGTGNYILSGAELNRIAYQFTGLLTGNRFIIVPNTVQQYWVRNNTTGPFTLTVKTAMGGGFTVNQGQGAILYSDGTDVVAADTAGVSVPIAVVDGGTGATTASGARINLGGTAVGIGVFTAVDQAAAYAALGRIPSVVGGTF